MASTYQHDFNPSSENLSSNLGLYGIEIIDTETGRPIDIETVSDTPRFARNSSDNSVYNKYAMDSNALASFLEDPSEGLNARSCVEALGLYTTTYINNKLLQKDPITKKDHNSDPTALDITPDLEDNLTFKTYLKGGPFLRNPDNSDISSEDSDSDFAETEKYRRLAPHLGIGLGEATILNPQFQFNKRDDPRTNPLYTKVGRIYSSEIMNNWPIVLFQPGRIKYHTGFFKMLGLGSGAGMNETLIRTGGEGLLGVLSKLWTGVTDIIGVVGSVGSAILGGNKVIEFRQARNLFRQYVEFLWKDLATIMGLMDGDGYCGSIRDLNLNKVIPTNIMNGAGGKGINVLNDQFISFRCSKDIIGSETFSNSTETNPLMENMNATAAEHDDATGGTGGQTGLGAIQANLKKLGLKAAGSFSEQAAVLSGKGRITLPDVFSSSSFSRSFTCSFKFHYPYGDTLGKFENLYIPFLTLLTMSAPRQIGKMSYTSPFAVRVFVKNKIMINYGMVESLSVTRGGDGNDWGPDGFPKTMSVEITIKDMEPNISLPLASRGPLRMALESMFPSCGISEYLATLGGLSLDDMTHNFRTNHFKRAGTMFLNAWKAKLDPSNIMSSVANTRMASNIIGLFSSVDFDTYNQLGDTTRGNYKENLENTAKVKFSAPAFGYHMVNRVGEDQYNGIAKIHRADDKALKTVESQLMDSPYGSI